MSEDITRIGATMGVEGVIGVDEDVGEFWGIVLNVTAWNLE